MHYSNLRHLILPSTTCAPLLNTWASQTNELAAIYFSTELLFLCRTPHELSIWFQEDNHSVTLYHIIFNRNAAYLKN